MKAQARSIPSLDGLRAVAVLSVILFHCETPLLDSHRWLAPFRNGSLGVTCFFVISGLLITTLLLNERDESGRIDLARFYVRRSFRIFPPFYVYLLVVGLLSLFHFVRIDLRSYLLAATYLRNYAPHPTVMLLSHTWSLCLEEQFYLVWPAVLFFLSPRVCLRIAGWVIVLSPFLRALTYALFPSVRDHIDIMLPTRLDAIMVGSLLALAHHEHAYTRLLKALSRPLWLIPVFVYFLAEPALIDRYRGSFTLLAGLSLDALGCGIVLLYATRVPHSWLGKLLNLRWLRHLGIISYSLYLWQQIFTGKNTFLFPANLVVIFLVAEASYWLIERPSIKIRNRFMPHRERLADVVKREDMISDAVC